MLGMEISKTIMLISPEELLYFAKALDKQLKHYKATNKINPVYLDEKNKSIVLLHPDIDYKPISVKLFLDNEVASSTFMSNQQGQAYDYNKAYQTDINVKIEKRKKAK